MPKGRKLRPEEIEAAGNNVSRLVKELFGPEAVYGSIVYHGTDFTLMMPTRSKEQALALILSMQSTLANVAMDIIAGRVSFEGGNLGHSVPISKLN